MPKVYIFSSLSVIIQGQGWFFITHDFSDFDKAFAEAHSKGLGYDFLKQRFESLDPLLDEGNVDAAFEVWHAYRLIVSDKSFRPLYLSMLSYVQKSIPIIKESERDHNLALRELYKIIGDKGMSMASLEDALVSDPKE